jgi:hypothetical protein
MVWVHFTNSNFTDNELFHRMKNFTAEKKIKLEKKPKKILLFWKISDILRNYFSHIFIKNN